jgi:hypothetical protein
MVRARATTTSWELLVQCQGRTMVNTTWELLNQFKEVFLDFELEDKLFRNWGGGGSVMDTFFNKQYMHMKKPTQGKEPIGG